MNDFLEKLKSIIKDTYNHLKDYIDDLKDNIKDLIHHLSIFHRIIDYFKQDYEILFKTKCDTISNDIKEIANLPSYLIIYFLIFIFLFIIVIFAYFYNFLSSYLNEGFIVGGDNIRTYIGIFIMLFLPIMILYSYYIYKRFRIKRDLELKDWESLYLNFLYFLLFI